MLKKKYTLYTFLLLMISVTLFAEERPETSDYTIVEKPEALVIGVECRTCNKDGSAVKDIPLLWERFFKDNIASQIPNKASEEIIALYCDYEGDYTQPYSLVIGAIVNSASEIPEGLVLKKIPAKTYAVYKAIGDHPTPVIETWHKIWNTDLPRTYTGDYELYGEKFTSKSPQEVDIFIAIEDKNAS